MNSLLQSSLYGHDFIKYRQNNTERERQRFSTKVKLKGVGKLPIVMDSVYTILSEA